MNFSAYEDPCQHNKYAVYFIAMNHLLVLGKRLAFLRKERGFSRAEVAKKAGLSLRFLADVEAGKGNISIVRLIDLCEALNISPSSLFSRLPGSGRSGFSSIFGRLTELDADQLEELSLWMSQRFERRRSLIALVGLRGAGKTTIGKKVASRLRKDFVELDELVERAAGLTLQNIFEVHGEEYYRRTEHDALLTFLGKRPSAVIAAGGGIVTREDTYESLRQHAVTFWLKADPQDHWDRVWQQDPRPMANDPNAMEQLQAILRRREPLYAKAQFAINTSELGVTDSVRAIIKLYRETISDKV